MGEDRIAVDYHLYSVPHQYIGKDIDVPVSMFQLKKQRPVLNWRPALNEAH